MILASRGVDVAVRDASLGSLLRAEGLLRDGLGAGVAVTGQAVGGLPAAKEAVRIAAEAVGKRRLGVYRGRDVERQPVRTTWQSRFFGGFPDDEGSSWYGVLEATEASLTSRNNAFWLKDHEPAGRVASVRVLHPDGVGVRWNRRLARIEYRYALEQGGWSEWLGREQVLHFRVGHVAPGSLVAPSPLRLHRDALRASLAKVRYEGDLYENGVLEGLVVSFPREVSREQAEEWRESFQAEHGGVANRSKVRVLGGGATMQTIGLSMEDAQYVESAQLSVVELARVFGVPASLLDAGSQPAKPITPEHEEMRWNSYGLEPRLARIAGTINADPDFFGRGTNDYVMFADQGARPDTTAGSAALVAEVQAGVTLVDEARAIKGLPPLPGGIGQIPQITPVGGAPNPLITPAAAAAADEEE